MQMGGWVKCLSPQNTSGVLVVISVAAKSNTVEVNGDRFFEHKKTTVKKHNMPPYCYCGNIQVSVSLDIHSRLETRSLTLCFKPKLPLIFSTYGHLDDTTGAVWRGWLNFNFGVNYLFQKAMIRVTVHSSVVPQHSTSESSSSRHFSCLTSV